MQIYLTAKAWEDEDMYTGVYVDNNNKAVLTKGGF
jgi:hypothetical protein